MSDAGAQPTLEELAARLAGFARERDWDQFHSPKNLAMALAGEVGEVIEHFQWLTEAQSLELPPEVRDAVALELADVLLYLVRLADRLGIDLTAAAPVEGDTATFAFTLPDGTAGEIVLTATATTPPGTGQFTIGASAAATTTNLQAALTTAVSTMAGAISSAVTDQPRFARARAIMPVPVARSTAVSAPGRGRMPAAARRS